MQQQQYGFSHLAPHGANQHSLAVNDMNSLNGLSIQQVLQQLSPYPGVISPLFSNMSQPSGMSGVANATMMPGTHAMAQMHLEFTTQSPLANRQEEEEDSQQGMFAASSSLGGVQQHQQEQSHFPSGSQHVQFQFSQATNKSAIRDPLGGDRTLISTLRAHLEAYHRTHATESIEKAADLYYLAEEELDLRDIDCTGAAHTLLYEDYKKLGEVLSIYNQLRAHNIVGPTFDPPPPPQTTAAAATTTTIPAASGGNTPVRRFSLSNSPGARGGLPMSFQLAGTSPLAFSPLGRGQVMSSVVVHTPLSLSPVTTPPLKSRSLADPLVGGSRLANAAAAAAAAQSSHASIFGSISSNQYQA